MSVDGHDSSGEDAGPNDDLTSTRLISRRIVVDGVEFQWWAVGDEPALVTVRSRVFGGRMKFTMGDAAACAARLADDILDSHYDRDRSPEAAAPPTKSEDGAPAAEKGAPRQTNLDVFSKPGWFSRS